ncbi:DUF2325 domain-containing protein [Ottowia thiooxydans]|uniref:DUF2325 domain-containing protein n=1 Tax=Ottowia thiooxydans TaxID=219182 RepID=A0ABV2Q5X0_9BURK
MPTSQAPETPSVNAVLLRMWNKLRSKYVVPCPEDGDGGLTLEHGILLRHYGNLQRRCSEQVHAQANELERLRGEIAHLRTLLSESDRALATERAEKSKLLNTKNGLEHRGDAPRAGLDSIFPTASTQEPGIASAASYLDAEWIEHSLRTADLVICQAACVSHSDFWRVEDHCKRTGKTCVLVEQPGALQILRIHPGAQTEKLAADSFSGKATS